MKDLAVVIGRDAGSASRLYAEAAAVRCGDSGFAGIAKQVAETLFERQQKRSWR